AVLSFAFSPFIPVPGQATGSPLALVICFVPRILVGIVPGLVFQGIQKMRKGKNTLALATAGIVGSVLNTALVMGLMYLLFQDAYAAAKGIETTMVLAGILGVVGTNGVAETV